ncbi:MAG: guanylate kinase [Gammaproteobacteria bacterium]|nr:guanylate kinase [Gammaproteobacteria bacterium]
MGSTTFMPVLVISAPSGAGKNTLINRLKSQYTFEYSISHTTRPMRPGEVNHVHYHFVSHEEFQALNDVGAFLETTFIHGQHYGTAWKNFVTASQAPNWLLLDLDVKGLRTLKEKIPDVVSVFILPPSLEVLRERILLRQPEINLKELELRLETARHEMEFVFEYDYSVFNADLERATDDLSIIFRAESLKNHRRRRFLESLMY